MQEAMKAVHEGKMSINRAAMEYAVLPTTLKDHLSATSDSPYQSSPAQLVLQFLL